MVKNNSAKALDMKPLEPLELGEASESLTRQLQSNKGGGMKINQDVWDDIIPVAKLLCLKREDPDIYDLFVWIREELNGCQPLSDALIEKVDREIERELGPWT